MKLKTNIAADAPLQEIASAVIALEVAFALFDEDDCLLFCNPAFKQAHKAISGVLEPGMMWPIFMQEAKRSGSGGGLDQINKHVMSGTEQVLKLEIARPNDRWVRLRVQPMENGGFAIIEADITDAHMAAELQAEAESMLRRVLDASGAMIMMVNINDGSIVYRSQAHRELMGEISHVLDIYADPNDRSDMLADILAVGELEGEIWMKKSDGSKFPARFWARLISYDDEEVVVSSMMDMTQQHAQRDELERQRQASFQNEKLTAMGELLAGVAHELNNPLSVVVGQSLMMREEDLSGDLARRVDKISSSAERCAKIVKTFLAMARQKPTKLEPVSLPQIIETALDVAGYGLRASGVEIILDIENNLPPILADEDQIAQVFINLLVNAEHALEAKGQGGMVTLKTRFEPVYSNVITDITDNGPGVPEHLQARIFEPFFTTKSIGSGTGIGLALCHRIIGTHEGALTLVDVPGEGACFRVSLPIANATEGTTDDNATQVQGAGMNALVVDDEPDVSEMICDMLKAVGINGTSAASGEEALEFLNSGKTFDLIVSDLTMPGIGGIGLLNEILTRWPALAKRLIFVTGDAMNHKIETVKEELGVPVLEKPVAPHELRATIGELVGSIET